MACFRIRCSFLLIGTVLFTAVSGLAQGVASAFSSAPAASSQQVSGPVATIRNNAQLVVVDVVVTDSKQNPVHNLKATDFTLTENSSPQHISSFEEHVAPSPTAKPAPMRPLPSGIFTNFTPVPEGRTVNVLLLDALNTSLKDQSYMRDQLREFLDHAPPGTRIAIFGLNTKLIMLQGFTSDLTLIRAAVARSSGNGSVLLEDNTGSDGTEPISEQVTNVMGDAGDMAQLLASIQQFEAVQSSIEAQIRAQDTLDAMNEIAHYLAGIPGRKNLIWFSGSFPIDIHPDPGLNPVLPNPSIAHSFDVVTSSEDELHETIDSLARSQVAVYPIDVRGLMTPLAGVSTDAVAANLNYGGPLKGLADASTDRTSRAATMDQLAESTGGHSYHDANGLAAAVTQAIDNGSNYYTLSYTPTSTKWNGDFRKIQVKLAEKGLTLEYRSGYYADPADAPAKSDAKPDPAKQGPPSALIRAMLYSAPCPTDIMLKLQVLPSRAAAEDVVAKGNTLTAVASKLKIKGPYRRYSIDIASDARDLHITKTADGHYEFFAVVLTYVYDVNGNLINSAEEKAHGFLTASNFANMLHVGVPFHQEISVPVKGDFYLRTAVHDLSTDHFGAVQVPISSVAKLAPAVATATPH